MKLYFAYGSNLNMEQMKWRCPNARGIQALKLPEWRLVFRGVADIEPAGKEDFVLGALFEITPDCERRLDRYEGFPSLYRKELFLVDIEGETHDVMFYRMNNTYVDVPSDHYFQSIADGYIDWGLDEKPLTAAFVHAWKETREDRALSERNAPNRRYIGQQRPTKDR